MELEEHNSIESLRPVIEAAFANLDQGVVNRLDEAIGCSYPYKAIVGNNIV